MKRTRRTARDIVIWLALTGGLVLMVLGQPYIGLAVLAFGTWQLIVAMRRDGGLFVDQRGADRPGKPTVS